MSKQKNFDKLKIIYSLESSIDQENNCFILKKFSIFLHRQS